MRTVTSIVKSLPSPPNPPQLPAPHYSGDGKGLRVGLAVKSMEHHSTDEGWELFRGLEAAGYDLAGAGILTRRARLPGDTKLAQAFQGFSNLTDARSILELCNPSVLVIQDKREWEGKTAGPGFNPKERFTGVEVLRDRPDVFKLTVLKDAHQEPSYHRQSAEEIGCHAWVVYYHPDIVHHLAPWTRRQHLVRTYHTVDPGLVPTYTPDGREGALLSGARNAKVYPLRERLWNDALSNREHPLPGLHLLPHPGYGRNHCHTPAYLRTLSRYKVAICTSSIYGYSLRRIFEATACGCMVLTDLPVDDVLPGIDGNLWRIDPDTPTDELGKRLGWMAMNYDSTTSKVFAERALERYSFPTEGKRLAGEIETMRRDYSVKPA